jgi:hypothetical protein
VIVLLISQIRGGGGFFLNFYFFDDPKIKPVYALEPCKQDRVHPLAYQNKEEMVNLDRGVKLDDS